MHIYQLMEDDWKIYCLMSSIVYIEEMSKPTEHIEIKRYKNKIYRCVCFQSIRLKMKDPDFVDNFFKVTKYWEGRKGIKLIGETFKKIRKENYSGQDFFLLTPTWINLVLKECGKIPNEYSFNTAEKRINSLKQYRKIVINKNKSLFDKMLMNKNLAAGAFVVSMDLEFRGLQGGSPSLCMSETYKDFLLFMLKVAQRWKWTENEKLSSVNVENSKKIGINASPQFEFRISIWGLKEIYKIAGPLMNPNKDKCIKFHIERSDNYVNKGGGNRKNNTKNKIIKYLKKNKNSTTTNIQFVTNTRTDVVLDHLHSLEKLGKVKKERKGKRYIWNIK